MAQPPRTEQSGTLRGTDGMDPGRPVAGRSGFGARLIGQLEDLPIVGVADKVLTAATEPWLGSARADSLRDLLHGRWMGHALHPAASDLPIGLWTSSVFADLLGLGKAAGALSAAGSASAVVTAASGVADWRDTYGRDRRLGALHGLLNTLGLSLQVASLVARGRRHRSARALGLGGWLVSVGAAYLGGELVFGRGQMVDHTAWTMGPSEWTPALSASELANGATKRAEVEGRGVLLYREADAVYALEDTCSHAGGPLSEGQVEAGVVTCPWHGSQFCLRDGSIRRGPATFSQLRLDTRVRDGMVEVRGREG